MAQDNDPFPLSARSCARPKAPARTASRAPPRAGRQADGGVTHNPVWAAKLAEHLAGRGIDTAPLIAAAGFPPGRRIDIAEGVPLAWIADFFERAAEAVDDPLLGFRFGLDVDSRDAGLIGFLGTYAETLRDGLVNTAAYARVFGQAIEFDMDALDTVGRMAFFYHLPPSVPHGQYVEWFAAGCLNGYRKVMKGPLSCTRVTFAHPRRIGVDEMATFFGCRVEFGAEENALWFRTADLARPIETADSKLAAFLRGLAEDALDRHADNVPPIRERVERAILPRISSGEVAREIVARDLGLSTRTLTRRLAEVGYTYRGLLDGLREALATRYLEQSDLSPAEITFLLGFADQSSFATAYRRWTGQTPGAVRRNRDRR